jgi:hypothetical protein
MQAEDLVFHNGGEGKEVEQIGVLLPYIWAAILSHALIVKTINLRDLPGFVISSKNGNAIGPAKLERDKQTDALHGIVTSVHIITHEKVICVGEMATNAKKLH